jgi:hypothetical protein
MNSLIVLSVLAALAPSPVRDLPAWLSGAWATTSGAEWTEEWWSTPRGGIMLGASRSGKSERLDFFEHMRIVRTASGVEFCAMPQGKPGACFPAISSLPDEIVFENGANDYPTRIAYRRRELGISAEISGPGGTRRQSWRLVPLAD